MNDHVPEPTSLPTDGTAAGLSTAVAVVSTDRAERYAKQLGEHLGRKVPVQEVADGRLVEIAGGACLLAATPEALVLTASAPDPASLERVQDVVGRHLERFGTRDELTVIWESA